MNLAKGPKANDKSTTLCGLGATLSVINYQWSWHNASTPNFHEFRQCLGYHKNIASKILVLYRCSPASTFQSSVEELPTITKWKTPIAAPSI